MTESFHVRVSKDYLVFSAAHFVTFNRDVCERLHGHNYRVAAEVFGPLDENHFVVDFVALRETLKQLVDELDHHVLLPTSHPLIHVAADERSVRATFQDREWVFPRGDCVLLPVANTTAELIARYLGLRLLDALEGRTGVRPHHIRLAVDECEGQWGICELIGE